MMFNDQVILIDPDAEPKLTPPSRWHVLYHLKWKFIVRPRLIRELAKAQARFADDTNNSSVLRESIK